jgi:multidrug resistance efflux pump
MQRIGRKFKESKKLRYGSLFLLVLLFIGGVFFYLISMDRIHIDDSVVNAPISSLSPSAAGILKEVDVSDGQQVKKGDQLAVVGSETLHAYTDGIVVDTNKQIGGSVTPQTPIVKMINLATMRIDGTIDENKGLDSVKIGQPVSFTVDALPGTTFWGFIDEISPTAKQSQAVFSISSERPVQQFEVFAHFDASNHPEIKNGMSAKMTVYTKTP